MPLLVEDLEAVFGHALADHPAVEVQQLAALEPHDLLGSDHH
jgi:hypothetical protein